MLDETQAIHTSPEEPTSARGAWYLLTGVILGLILGLVYAWVIDPIVYESTLPGTLAEEHKATYRCMIAQVYAVTGNLERAVLRLEVLADEDPYYALGAQAQRAMAAGKSEEARALALLASALQLYESDSEFINSTLSTPTTTQNIIPTHTLPVPTSIP